MKKRIIVVIHLKKCQPNWRNNMKEIDFNEFLNAADIAARKVHKSNAKHMVVNHVWNSEKGKYVKVKRFRAHSSMSKKEERKFFGHDFKYVSRKNVLNIDGVSLLFDKNDQLCDVLPLTEDTKKFLDENRGVPSLFFNGAEQVKNHRCKTVKEVRL